MFPKNFIDSKLEFYVLLKIWHKYIFDIYLELLKGFRNLLPIIFRAAPFLHQHRSAFALSCQ